MTGSTLDERIAERSDVTGRDPDLRVHEDPGVEPDDVLAFLDHRPPPSALDVVLQLDPERTVIPDGIDAAIDLARWEDEATPLRQGDDRVEVGDGGRDVAGALAGGVSHGLSWATGRGMDGRVAAGPRC